MGIRLQFSPHLIPLMSQEDQAKFGPGIHPPYQEDHHPPPKTDRLERDEQRQFANWCLLKGYAPVWHSTHNRSRASVGCPDFIVTVNGTTLWIEFKRVGSELSDDQKDFARRLVANGGLHFVVYTAHEAIALTEKYDRVI